jgi:hypothetical protein
VLKHFQKVVEDRRRAVAMDLASGSAESYDKYMWHVGYMAGMLQALSLFEELVDAASDAEE